tara:strand:- start:164 stop:388 length:225 start_codon:yes stop_codon:yes gene_type:complete
MNYATIEGEKRVEILEAQVGLLTLAFQARGELEALAVEVDKWRSDSEHKGGLLRKAVEEIKQLRHQLHELKKEA